MNSIIKELIHIYESKIQLNEVGDIKPSEHGLIRKVYARIEALVKTLPVITDFATFAKTSKALREAVQSYAYGRESSPTMRDTENELKHHLEKITGQKLSQDFENSFRIPRGIEALRKGITNEADALYAAYFFASYINTQIFVGGPDYYGQEVKFDEAKKAFDLYRGYTAAKRALKKGSEEAGFDLDV